MIRLILLLVIQMLLLSCGPKIAGTGQHGEAAIAGVVIGVDGAVAKNQSIKIARVDYRKPIGAISYDSFTIDSITSDNNGFFRVLVPINGSYTISSKLDSTFILLSNKSIKDDDIDLGEIRFEGGESITLYPWWGDGLENEILTVEGTDWFYLVSGDSASTINLPKGEVVLLQEGSSEKIAVNTEDITSIGDSAKYISPIDSTIPIDSSSRLFTAPEFVAVNKSVTIKFLDFTMGSRYHISWGDSSNVVDTAVVISDVISHKYTTVGSYTIIVKELVLDSKMDSSWIEIKDDQLIIKVE
jgi:hypothetical protein